MKFALVGNPNSGKTTLFNSLTGSTAHVGNWPGVTVDRKEGKYKSLGDPIDIIDLPGIYSLSPYSPEEVVARNYILDDHPDLIINIVDATNLERNLYLTTQLLETDCPVIVALNMMDVMQKDGISIHIASLEKSLGIPVTEISALKNTGLKELMQKAAETAKKKRQGSSVLSQSGFGPQYDRVVALLKDNSVEHPCFHAAKLLEGDPEEELLDSAIVSQIDTIKATIKLAPSLGGDFEAAIADARYRVISSRYVQSRTGQKAAGSLSHSDKIDRILTNKWLGIPIFLFIMFLCFHLIFAGNLFGLPGIPAPGIWLAGLAKSLIGWLTDGMAGLLIGWGAGEGTWVHGLIINGIFTGVGAVLGFLPLVLLLYLFLSILEDSGYMARAAFLMDRIMRHFGLSGKAFMPLLMGFGCSVPAIGATKTLENDKEKRIAIILTIGFSCGAKLPIWTLFAAAFFPGAADIMVFGIYLAGILCACIFGVILNKFFFKGESSPFVMELPSYRMPQLKNLLMHIWEKFKGYLFRAGTVIAAASIIIWFLSNFSFTLQMVEENSTNSIVGIIGGLLRPLFIPLGFASDVENGWKAVVAILTGLVAKEMVVASLGLLYGVQGSALEDKNAAGSLALTLQQYFTPLSAIAFMLFNLLSVPCIAAVAAAHAELRNWKWTIFMLCFWLASAYAVSVLVYQIGSLLGF